jgi:ATP synthase protein I
MVIQKITGNIKNSLTLRERHATKRPVVLWGMSMKKSGDQGSDLKSEMIHLLANYGHVGFTFVACIFIGLGGGILLDQKMFDGRTAPWFTFIGLAFGIAAGFKTLLQILWRGKDKNDEKGDRG